MIDEQHRFAVPQREAFRPRGHYPHLLGVTAERFQELWALPFLANAELARGPVPSGRGEGLNIPRNWTRSLDNCGAF